MCDLDRNWLHLTTNCITTHRKADKVTENFSYNNNDDNDKFINNTPKKIIFILNNFLSNQLKVRHGKNGDNFNLNYEKLRECTLPVVSAASTEWSARVAPPRTRDAHPAPTPRSAHPPLLLYWAPPWPSVWRPPISSRPGVSWLWCWPRGPSVENCWELSESEEIEAKREMFISDIILRIFVVCSKDTMRSTHDFRGPLKSKPSNTLWKTCMK